MPRDCGFLRDEIVNGHWHEEFVVDVIQGGAGTSTNMNANEVICNRALEILGHKRGEYQHLHPNTHVNMSQSTNNAYPTAIRLALKKMTNHLVEEIDHLHHTFFKSYPHQFSGGQRQRIAIAGAIILTPALVIADEPISALDVSIQSQILNLSMDLQEEMQLTFLFITHDISVVKHISDQVAVMYLGQIVELAPGKDLFENPRHPYTRLLFSAVPDISQPFLSAEQQIKGEIPNPTVLPPDCYFAPRCPLQNIECIESRLDLLDRGGDHLVRCFHAD